MRGTLCPLSCARPPLSSSSSSSFQPYVPFSPSPLLLPAHYFPPNLFHLLPPAPLVLSLTRYYLCRWASQFLYIICEEPSLEGRQNGLEWTEDGDEMRQEEQRGEGEKERGKRIWNFQDCGVDALQIPIRAMENTEKTGDYRPYNRILFESRCVSLNGIIN